MIIKKESHLDHGLTVAQLAYVLEQFGECFDPICTTIDLPLGLGSVECALIGPATGFAPVPESDVEYIRRGDRQYSSRVVRWWPHHSRQLTVIAGPHGEGAA